MQARFSRGWRGARRVQGVRTVRGLALALACCAAPGSIAQVQAAGNEIVVGQIVDQSSAWMEAGRDYMAGAKTYFDLVNSEGGVNGKRIVHVSRDGGGTPDGIARAAAELLGEARADVLFGNVGDATMRALNTARVAEKQNVVVFAPLTGLPPAGREVKTMRASYADEARSLMRHFAGLGLGTFCVVVPPGLEPQATLAALREAAKSTNHTLACEVPIDESGNDAARTAQAVSSKKPQAVIVLGDTTVVGNFVRAFPFKSLGIAVGALSVVNHTALIEIAGPKAARGVVLTQVVPAPQKETVPIVREHVRAMRKFRDEPPSHLSLEGFIAAKTMIEALRRGGAAAKSIRREDVTAALTALPDASLTALTSEYASSVSGGNRLIEVTMVGGDGRLVQ